jgi:hypothetical protein
LGRLTLVVATGILPLGCGSDTTGPTPAANAVFWALRFNWKAVNMALTAPYNTAQLTATPVTVMGDSIRGAGPVTYTVADSSVAVSSTGLVTAHYTTNKALVVASVTINGMTQVDTALIRVTPSNTLAAPLATLSIQPKSDGLDSAKIAQDAVTRMNINGTRGAIPVYATVATGDPVTDTVCNIRNCPLLMGFTSSDANVAAIDPVSGRVTAGAPGHVTFAVSSLVYGVGRRDSLPFTVGYRLGIGIPANFAVSDGGSSSHPILIPLSGTYLLGIGGSLGVFNQGSQSIEVVFDYHTPTVHRVSNSSVPLDKLTDTVAAGAGLIPRVQFDSAGTYTFRLTLLSSGESITGQVVISGGP